MKGLVNRVSHPMPELSVFFKVCILNRGFTHTHVHFHRIPCSRLWLETRLFEQIAFDYLALYYYLLKFTNFQTIMWLWDSTTLHLQRDQYGLRSAHGIVPPLLCLVLCKGFKTSLGKTGKTDSNHVFKQCFFPFLSLNSDHIHLSLWFFSLAPQEPLREELCMYVFQGVLFIFILPGLLFTAPHHSYSPPSSDTDSHSNVGYVE